MSVSKGAQNQRMVTLPDVSHSRGDVTSIIEHVLLHVKLDNYLEIGVMASLLCLLVPVWDSQAIWRNYLGKLNLEEVGFDPPRL